MMYKIPVYWTMYGEFDVEANSIEDAIELVYDGSEEYDGLPENGEYVDGSLRINHDCLRELNP